MRRYVGGGFGAGIHNVLEANGLGNASFVWSNNKHFAEAQGLLQWRGGIEIEDYETFSLIMSQLSDDSAYYDTCGQEQERSKIESGRCNKESIK